MSVLLMMEVLDLFRHQLCVLHFSFPKSKRSNPTPVVDGMGDLIGPLELGQCKLDINFDTDMDWKHSCLQDFSQLMFRLGTDHCPALMS